MIKPWIFEFFRAPTDEGILVPKPRANVSPTDVAAEFRAKWNVWTRAEGYGFEGIFFSEHHFGPGYSPSPNLLIAALAPLTKKLRLGVMGVVLPYHQISRVIEEIGMLDHLTGGRLEIGTASGIPPEMAQIGLGVAEASERNAEAQEVLDWALTHPGKPITHHGKFWNFDNLTLVPMPLQRPAPNRWTTVVSESSARRSAQRGTKICTGFSATEQVKKVFDGYREEASKVGIDAKPEFFGLRRGVTIAKDGGKARALAQKVEDQVRNIFLKHDNRVNTGPVPDAPQQSQGGIQLSGDEYIAGSPAEVAEQIMEQCGATGAGHFLAMLDGHGGTEANREAFELFGQEVIPRLRRTGRSRQAPLHTEPMRV